MSHWITFPKDKRAPLGIGVTAFSEDDAIGLIKEAGYENYIKCDFVINRNIAIKDLDQNHVVPNMGPITFRGVWYPCWNVGFEASGQRE